PGVWWCVSYLGGNLAQRLTRPQSLVSHRRRRRAAGTLRSVLSFRPRFRSRRPRLDDFNHPLRNRGDGPRAEGAGQGGRHWSRAPLASVGACCPGRTCPAASSAHIDPRREPATAVSEGLAIWLTKYVVPPVPGCQRERALGQATLVAVPRSKLL